MPRLGHLFAFIRVPLLCFFFLLIVHFLQCDKKWTLNLLNDLSVIQIPLRYGCMSLDNTFV